MPQKFTLASGAATADRLNGFGNSQGSPGASIQLSDGSYVFAYFDAGPVAWKLAATSDRATITTIDSSLSTTSGATIAIARDASDNLYVLVNYLSGASQISTLTPYAKGSGLAWTKKSSVTPLNSSAFMSSPSACALTWCNTGGGTGNSGHLIAYVGGNGNGTNGQASTLLTYDAGALIAGSAPGAIQSYVNPACMPGRTDTNITTVAEISLDGFGATSGMALTESQSQFLTIGSWAISNAGALTTNTNIGGSGSVACATGGTMVRARLIRFAAGTWVAIYPSSTTTGRFSAARYSTTALLTAPVDLTPPAGFAAAALTNNWDAQLDPVTANKAWVFQASSVTANTILRVAVSLGGGVTWDTSATTDDTAVGTGTDTSINCVRDPNTPKGDYIVFNNNAGTYALVGDYSQYNLPPTAPTLTTPANGSVADLASGQGFAATFNSPIPGNTLGAYAFRIKSTGAYSYWNAGTGTLQSTIVWNTAAAMSVSIPAGVLTDGGTVYNWSFAAQDQRGAQGPFATDFAVTGALQPSVAITAPTSTVTVANPTVNWTFSPGVNGDTQQSYRVVVEHGTYGVTPGSGTQDYDSTVVADANARSRQIPVSLANATSYRVFVQCVESNGNTSSWAYSTFSESYDNPATPSISVAFDPAYNRAILNVQSRDNLLTLNQSSFESGTTGWAVGQNCTIAQTATQALDGGFSMSITGTGAGDALVTTPAGTSGVVVQPGTQYGVLAYFKAATAARTCYLRVVWSDINGNQLGVATTGQITDSTTAWTPAYGVLSSPAGAAYASVGLYVVGPANTEVHYADCVSLAPANLTVQNSNFETAGAAINTPAANILFNDGFEGAAVAPTLLDSRTIVQSNDFETAPSTVDYGHSIGTEALGTLAAWTTEIGSPSIASNLVTMPSGAHIKTGHPDIGDVTWEARFVAAAGFDPFVKIHVTDLNNYINAQCDGSTLYLQQRLSGTTTTPSSVAAALTNGNSYRLRLTGSGTTYTASVYNDTAGVIGSLVATTSATIANAALQSGQVGLANGGASSGTFGGAFTNVCYATGPAPTGWTPGFAGGNWASQKEPWFCWSNKKSYFGTHSLSVWAGVVGVSAGWYGPAFSLTSGLAYQWNCYATGSTGSQGNFGTQDSTFGTGYQNLSATSWTLPALAGSYTATVTGSKAFNALANFPTVVGTVYFDYATIIQPVTPTGVLFRSLGTDATGTLNAWTSLSGTATIAGNAASFPASTYYKSGHADWTDETSYWRFTYTAGAVPLVSCHCTDLTTLIYSRWDGTTLSLFKKTGGANTSVASAAVSGTTGSFYFCKVTASGTAYTVTLYDDAAGFVGDQIGQVTATITEANIQSGALAVGNDGGSGTVTFGGAFANVCIVQGNTPTGWNLLVNGGEPAFAWSKTSPYAGTFSASVYVASTDSAGDGRWYPANVPVTGTYQIGAAYKTTGTTSQINDVGAGAFFSLPNSSGAWALFAQSVTLTGNAGLRLVGRVGTTYFDNVTITAGYSTVPNNVALQSLGAAGVWTPRGDIAAWTQVQAPSATILNNVVTLGNGTIIAVGHPDWGDLAPLARVQWNAGTIALLGRFIDANNLVRLGLNSAGITIDKYVGGASSTGLATAAFTPVAGQWYWLRQVISGTTHTAYLYSDVGGLLGSQLATCSATVADAALSNGRVGLQSFGGTNAAGGAFAHTFTVQAPMPALWTPTQVAGEPSFCWSSLFFHSGTRSASVYVADSGSEGVWVTPTGAAGIGVSPSTLYSFSTFFKTNRQGGTSGPKIRIFEYNSAGTLLAESSAMTSIKINEDWTLTTGSITTGASTAYIALGLDQAGVGTVYFDDAPQLAWTRGGLVGGQTIFIKYSDDNGLTWKYVRGASALTPSPTTQQATTYDYEATPSLTRLYQAFTSALAGVIVSGGSQAIGVTPNPAKFWLKYPKNPSLNMAVNPDIPLPHSRPETQTTFAILGKSRPVVGADTILGHQSSGTVIHTQSLAEWNALQALLLIQDVLLFQSPFGEQWYIRLGGAGTGGSGHRSYELHGPDASDPTNQYRQVTIAYVEVDMPPTP